MTRQCDMVKYVKIEALLGKKFLEGVLETGEQPIL